MSKELQRHEKYINFIKLPKKNQQFLQAARNF